MWIGRGRHPVAGNPAAMRQKVDDAEQGPPGTFQAETDSSTRKSICAPANAAGRS